MRPGSLAALAAALLCLVAARARAFPQGSSFDADPIESAGGGGIHFTGAANFPMATCAACHINAPGTVGVRLAAEDPSLFDGGYIPGVAYKMEVKIVAETKGLDYDSRGPLCKTMMGVVSQCNTNGFALEADDVTGAPVGGFAAGGEDTVVSKDQTAILAAGYLPSQRGQANGPTEWHFTWTAPAAGSGPIVFNIGVVDGDGGAATVDNTADPYNDDTVQAHITVAEAGGQVFTTTGGCRAAGPSPTERWPFALAAVGLALVWLRVRSRRRQDV